MSASSRSRVRAAVADWQVPARTPETREVDERLRAGAGRTGLLQVLIDHDSPGAGRCPRCGWVPTTTSRRDCPSRVIALALLERRPLPAWLAHLAGQIPGAPTKQPAISDGERRVVEDAEPGLFEAPPRVQPRGGRGPGDQG